MAPPEGSEPRQGDTRRPGTPVAAELLAAPAPANHACAALDGSPRDRAVHFHRNGQELVIGAFAGTFPTAAPRAHPAVAVTVAAHHQGAKALPLRGGVTLAEADGPAGGPRDRPPHDHGGGNAGGLSRNDRHASAADG